MSLKDYLNNGWIRKHEPSVDEISKLMAIADRDITQSQVRDLSPEWRFDIAYNSVLQAAVAALAAAGFRAERQNKHMRTLECLRYSIEIEQQEVDFLDACRRKRHIAVYDQVGAISLQEAKEMTDWAKRIRQRVEQWVRTVRPDLWPK